MSEFSPHPYPRTAHGKSQGKIYDFWPLTGQYLFNILNHTTEAGATRILMLKCPVRKYTMSETTTKLSPRVALAGFAETLRDKARYWRERDWAKSRDYFFAFKSLESYLSGDGEFVEKHKITNTEGRAITQEQFYIACEVLGGDLSRFEELLVSLNYSLRQIQEWRQFSEGKQNYLRRGVPNPRKFLRFCFAIVRMNDFAPEDLENAP